jgi:hypothetical protein
MHRAPRYKLDEPPSRVRMYADDPPPAWWLWRHWVRLTLVTLISATVAIAGVLLYGLHR